MQAYWISTKNGKRAIAGRPRGGEWIEDEIREWKKEKVDIVISALTGQENEELGLVNEGSLCAANGLTFLSIPIEDRSVPESADDLRDKLTVAREYLSSGKTVVVHCRMAIGRSWMISAALLFYRGFSIRYAFEAIEKARGWPVPDTPKQRDWIEQNFFAEGPPSDLDGRETGVE